MNKDERRARKTEVIQAISDAEAIVRKKFPNIPEEKVDYRIAVLAITKMLLKVSD